LQNNCKAATILSGLRAFCVLEIRTKEIPRDLASRFLPSIQHGHSHFPNCIRHFVYHSRQPVHVHAEVVQAAQINIGGYFAALQDAQQKLALCLNDDFGQQWGPAAGGSAAPPPSPHPRRHKHPAPASTAGYSRHNQDVSN
jgi:hypothetical protein